MGKYSWQDVGCFSKLGLHLPGRPKENCCLRVVAPHFLETHPAMIFRRTQPMFWRKTLWGFWDQPPSSFLEVQTPGVFCSPPRGLSFLGVVLFFPPSFIIFGCCFSSPRGLSFLGVVFSFPPRCIILGCFFIPQWLISFLLLFIYRSIYFYYFVWFEKTNNYINK